MLADVFGLDGVVVIIIVAVLLFGGAAIPKLARNLGSAKNEFEKGMSDGKQASAAGDSTSTAPDSAAPASAPKQENPSSS